MGHRTIRARAYPGFRGMKRLGVFILPPGWDDSPTQGYPQHFTGTHLYTWVDRGTVGVKCLAQEHNTMSPARTRTRTTRSGVEHTNHEATAPGAVPSFFLSQFHICPRSFASRPNIHFFGQSLSRRHYQPTYQPPEGVYLLK